MKISTITFFLILLIFPLVVHSQVDQRPIISALGLDSDNIEVTDFEMDSFGGDFYISGNYTNSFSVQGNAITHEGGTDSFVIKFDDQNQYVWHYSKTNSNLSLSVSDLVVNSQGVFATGEFDFVNDTLSFSLLKLNKETGVLESQINSTYAGGGNTSKGIRVMQLSENYLSVVVHYKGTFNATSSNGLILGDITPFGSAEDHFVAFKISTSLSDNFLSAIQFGNRNELENIDGLRIESSKNNTNYGTTYVAYETNDTQYSVGTTTYNRPLDKDQLIQLSAWDWNDNENQTFQTRTINNQTVNTIKNIVAGFAQNTGYLHIFYNDVYRKISYDQGASLNAVRAGGAYISDFSGLNVLDMQIDKTNHRRINIYVAGKEDRSLDNSFFIPVSSFDKTNIYRLEFSDLDMNLEDIDVMGEVSNNFDVSSLKFASNQSYGMLGVIPSQDSVANVFSSYTNTKPSTEFITFRQPEAYSEIISPMEGDTLKRFTETNFEIKGYDLISTSISFVDQNSANRGLPPVSLTDENPEKTYQGQAVLDNTNGSYLGDIQFKLQRAQVAFDTVNVHIKDAPKITATSLVNFGTILAKRELFKPYTLQNEASVPVTITGISLRNQEHFVSQVTGFPIVIDSNQERGLPVIFSPNTSGSFKDTLDIYSNAVNGVVSIPLVGSATDVSPSLRFVSSEIISDGSALTTPNSLNRFTATPERVKIGNRDTLNLHIRNIGTDTLYLNNLHFVDNSVLSIAEEVEESVGILPNPENTPENRTFSIPIVFEPNDYRTFVDTLVFATNDIKNISDANYIQTQELVKIPIEAVGYDNTGILTVSDPLNNSMLSENDSKEVQFYIQNEGETALSISDVSYSGDYFSIPDLTSINETPVELEPDETRFLSLYLESDFYDIEDDSVLMDSLTFIHNGYGGETKLMLTTTITKTRPVLQLNQTLSQFTTFSSEEGLTNEYVGEVPIQELTTKSFEFTNTGNDTLKIERVVVSSLNGQSIDDKPIGYYSISKPSEQNTVELIPGESSTFTATFEVLKFENFQVQYDIYHNSNTINAKTHTNQSYQDYESDGKYTHSYSGVGSTPNIYAQLSEVLTDTIHPSFVNVLFQATTPQGVGITFLDQQNPDVLVNGIPKPNFFTLKEAGSEIKPNDAESDFQILKQDAIDFELNTAVVLDKSASIGFENLPLIKEAAIALVREIEDNQRIGIFTFSSQVQPIIGFTSDTTALINAINNIELQGSSTNLYGGVVTAADSLDNYITSTLSKISQANIVVFTDGQENTGQYTIQQVQAATQDIDVYAVGVGDASATELQQITGFSGRVFQSENPSELTKEFQKIQREISKLANSFYWINYISPKRFGDNNITITVDGNLYSSSLNTSFNAEGFDDVSAQVVINQDFPNVFGDDTVYVPENSQVISNAVTILNGKVPNYIWTSNDESIVKVLPNSPTATEVILVPQGSEGDETKITVVDNENRDLQGNLLQKTFVVVLGEPVTNSALSFSVPAGTTGTFNLDDNGSVLNIIENTGDAFNITIQKSTSSVGTAPEGVENIFEETGVSIDLSSSGTANIIYALTFDVSGISFSNESLATILKREDSSSEWQNVKDLANTTVSVENGLITVSGLTSFSEFAIAEETEENTVSNESLTSVPASFSLDQNYPNPFNPSTTIRFGLPNASEVNIEIYNMIGQKVMVLSNNRFGAGWHTVSFNASGLSSGIYIYRIRAGSFVDTKRMTLIK